MTVTTDYPRDWVAAHESGHAAARWALGRPFLRVVIDPPPAQCEPLPGSAFAGWPDVLALACGCLGEFMHRGVGLADSQVAALLQGGPGDLIELRHLTTGKVVARFPRAPGVAPDADLHYLVTQQAPKWTPAQAVSWWRQAEAFAVTCRAPMRAVAAALLERGQLSYEEVSALAAGALAGQRQPLAIPPWARAA